MNIYFNIDYKTIFGEELILNIVQPGSNNETGTMRYRMNTIDGCHWWFEMKKQATDAENLVIDYYYSLENAGKIKCTEWQRLTHRVEFNQIKAQNYTIYDRWKEMPEDTYLYSSAFTECINRRHADSVPQRETTDKVVRLVVRAPQLRGFERLAITGADNVLGAWDIDKALPMVEHNHNEWTIDLDADKLECTELEFKFVAININNQRNSLWECGYNRNLTLQGMEDGDVVVYDLSQAFFEICDTKLAGTLVPVFSLRSETSFGVGDFGDLKKMIDFCAVTHQRVLQVLPINDTTTTHTWTDSYPYSCISIFAIHPQYADLSALPEIKDSTQRERFEALRKELNSLPQIDYERVNNAKTEYLRIIYSQERAQTIKSQAYKKFFDESAHWLVPYAQYCALREQYGTGDFTKWPDHNVWNEADRKALTTKTTKAYKAAEFYYFVQFILSKQMQEAHEHARRNAIILKGDIPIGVSRNGCDVWMEPKYFNLNGQAGAPPDNFSVNGQNWGFPTYNWETMLEDGCAWWVRRFQNMAKYFDAYRIDHVLGFFRIWEIPIHSVHGLLGQFSPALAMTRQEISNYGLNFQEEFFTRPFIADWIIDRIFGEHAETVRITYLNHLHDDIYEMKPEYDTQRKVEAAFAGKTGTDDIWIRDGLYALISNVLFVRDRIDSNKFHPRISAQLDFTYMALYDNDKYAFNRLYNDYFYRRNNQFWYYEAMKKLPKLAQATGMLICAEDLGMVPDCVPWVMRELRILSLELQSMPKDPSVRFGVLSKNPYRSVCTISSHDMPTLRQWWDEDYNRTQAYYNQVLKRGGTVPHPLPGWLARDIIELHLFSPSMLCVLSIQDWLAIDEKIRLADQNAERINIPANPKHYWRYRMHINIEDLIKNNDFKENLAQLIINSGRN